MAINRHDEENFFPYKKFTHNAHYVPLDWTRWNKVFYMCYDKPTNLIISGPFTHKNQHKFNKVYELLN